MGRRVRELIGYGEGWMTRTELIGWSRSAVGWEFATSVKVSRAKRGRVRSPPVRAPDSDGRGPTSFAGIARVCIARAVTDAGGLMIGDGQWPHSPPPARAAQVTIADNAKSGGEYPP